MKRKEWEKAVRIALIEKEISQGEMADELGLSRSYISNILTGKVVIEKTIRAISDYCGVEPYTREE